MTINSIFAQNIISTLYNTVSGKKIAFMGWAFKKDTNDTRETPAMYVAAALLDDRAEIHIYDPKVPETRNSKPIFLLVSQSRK